MSNAPRSLRKVIIVNTADEGGGAERMSMLTLEGFLERGIDTWLLVGDKKTDHPRVMPFFLSPFFDYGPFQGLASRAVLEFAQRGSRALGLEDFEYPYSHYVLSLTGSAPDLVLCHNLHPNFFDLRALAPLSKTVPVAVRLFCSWLFTGHCAQALGCERWEIGCGACPDLNLPPAIPFDLTRLNWQRKRRALADCRLFVSAESEWMLQRARRSLLAPAVVDWRHIRGGVDLSVFRPGSKTEARRELGISENAAILLYVVNGGPVNRFKDFHTVRSALALVAQRPHARPIELLVAGSSGPDERVSDNAVIRQIGYVQSPARMVQLFRAADVYVHASLEEPFGLSVCEALACGTPTVLASAGGVLENVRNGENALVVPVRDAAGLGEAIARLLAFPDIASAIGKRAAEDARHSLDHRVMIQELHDWCLEICRVFHQEHAHTELENRNQAFAKNDGWARK